jgi:hypothetical protein
LKVAALLWWNRQTKGSIIIKQTPRKAMAKGTSCPQISVPGPRNHTTLPDLLAATKYRVLVSAVYGAGESMAVSVTGRTGE